jgi:hypothetical protein
MPGADLRSVVPPRLALPARFRERARAVGIASLNNAVPLPAASACACCLLPLRNKYSLSRSHKSCGRSTLETFMGSHGIRHQCVVLSGLA